jgi:hypothetical protein
VRMVITRQQCGCQTMIEVSRESRALKAPFSLKQTPEEESLRQTGEWWIDPWWLNDNFLEVRPRTATQVQEAFEYLKEIFTPGWLRSYKGELIENLFLRSILYERSTFTRNHLISLSERLKRFENIGGIHIIIRGLRGRHESDAADMELDLADYFLQEGYQVEFPIAKSSRGKSADIRLSKGCIRLAVECKRLRVSKNTAWLNNVFNIATSSLTSISQAHGLGVDFTFSSEVVRGLLEKCSSGMAEEEAAKSLIYRVSEEIKSAVVRNRWPLWMWIVRLGNGFFFKTESTAGSSVGCPEMPDELLFRRMLQNAVIPAARQLSNEDVSGLIAIHARDIPSEEYLAEETNQFFFENRDSCAHILAVLIFPWQGWFQRNRPHFIINRHGQYVLEESDVESVLRKFDPIIV